MAKKQKKTYTRDEVRALLMGLMPCLINQAHGAHYFELEAVTNTVDGDSDEAPLCWKQKTRAEREHSMKFASYHAGCAHAYHDMIMRMERDYEALMDKEELWPDQPTEVNDECKH